MHRCLTIFSLLALGCNSSTYSPPSDVFDGNLPADTSTTDSMLPEPPHDAGVDASTDAAPDAPSADGGPAPDAEPDAMSMSVCGNGVLEEGELCEPGDTQTCTPSCGFDGSQTCTAVCAWGTCIAGNLSCNDGNSCTMGDVCSGAICAGTPIGCDTPTAICASSTTLRTYSDGACEAGACEYTEVDTPCPAPENGAGVCADGVCTGFTCDPGYVACGAECLYISCDCDQTSGCWESMSVEGAPDSRWYHTAVWTGTEMIVWGGFDAECGTEMASGGRYDPVADTWATLSTDGAPSPRMNHTAIWTGTEMIVWGGRTCEPIARLSDGAAYDPATNTWASVPSADTPEARSHHTAIWTGTEMIVWGGRNLDYLADGGLYHTVTEIWSSLAVDSVPASRDSHTAIWTGTEMIVWGGRSGSGYPADAGAYATSTESWSSLPDGPVVGRVEHTAIWTGTEMIIWGGWREDTSYLGDGASFMLDGDPPWILLSPDGAPSARGAHTTVWTGSEMIVWGGHDSGLLFGDGSRYDSAVDAWLPVSTGDAPIPRSYHTAIWAAEDCWPADGAQPCMIVWGGSCIGTACPDGARYFPPPPAP